MGRAGRGCLFDWGLLCLRRLLLGTTLASALLMGGSVVSAGAGAPRSAWDPTSSPQYAVGVAAGEARDQTWVGKRKALLASPATVASETAYANESASQALATAVATFPGWLTAPLASGPPLASGEKIVGYLGSHEAAVQAPHGRRAALFSTLPLLGLTSSGATTPIDLTLDDDGSVFSPRSTAARLTLPKSAAGAIRFTDLGFGISYVSARDQAGQRTHGRVFYGDAQGASANTDMAVAPDPTGVEVSWLLRAASAPEDHALRFDLPPGGKLVLEGAASGPQQVRILDGKGTLVGLVFPPTAVDAIGDPVPASYFLSGHDILVMHVAHREGTYRYPILADPLVAAWSPGMYASWSTSTCSCDFAGEFSWGNDGNNFTYTDGPSTIGQGSNGQWGDWYDYSVAGAYIYEQYSYNIWHFPNDSQEAGGIGDPQNTYYEPGTWADTVPSNGSGPGGSGGPYATRYQSGQESYINTDYCAGGTTDGTQGGCPVPAHGTIGANNLGVTAGVNLTGAIGSGYIPRAEVYGDDLYESDDVIPTLSNVSTSGLTNGQWTQTPSITVTGTGAVSTGLGMGGIQVNSSLGGTNYNWTSCSSFPCPFTLTESVSPSLSNGANALTVTAIDLGGNSSTAQSVGTACYDTTPPSTQESGTLWNPTGGIITPGQQTLTVNATDGTPDNNASDQQSGVKSTEVRATYDPPSGGATGVYDSGPQANTNPGVTQDGCGPSDGSQSQTFTVDTTGWTPGKYTIVVTTLDNVGNIQTDTETVTVAGEGSLPATAQQVEQSASSAGERWTLQSTGDSTNSGNRGDALYGVSCPTAMQCEAVGDSGSYQTTNGGTNWSPQAAELGNTLTGVSCADVAHCWAVGARGIYFYLTTEFGSFWSPQDTSSSAQGLNGITCPTTSVCVAVGPGGTVLATTDGGRHGLVRRRAPPRISPALAVLQALIVGRSVKRAP